LLLALVIGGLVAAQPATNAMLSKHTGALAATFASLLVSLVIIGFLLVVAGEVGRLGDLSHFRPVHLLGGIAGAAVVGGSIYLIGPLGATVLTGALVTTQLSVSAVLDWGGFLGVDKLPISLVNVVGIILLAAGTVLVAIR
jgi:transporter family-2 protein